MRLTEQVVRAMRWDTAGALVASGLTFLTTIWIVRLLGADRFGTLAALLGVLSLGQLVLSAGFRQALLRFVPDVARDAGAGAVVSLVVRATLARTLILVGVSAVLVSAPGLVAEALLGRPDLAPYVRLLPLLLAPPLYVDVLAATLIAQFRQSTVRAADVANKIAFALGLLALPRWADPVHGVFAAWIAGWLTAGVWLAIETLRHGVRSGSGVPVVSGRRWLAFSGAAYVLSLVAFVLGREFDVVLLTRLGVPAAAVAAYAVASALVASMLALPMIPISGGFDVPLVARLHGQRDQAGLRQLYTAFFEYVYIFVVPLVGGGVLLGGDLLAVFYGPAYGAAGPVLSVLLISLGSTKIGGITAPFLMATDRERLLLRIRLSTAALNAALALVLIPLLGVAGAAIATGASMIVLAAWELSIVQRLLAAACPWGFLARVGLATAVMMIALAFARHAAGPRPGIVGMLALAALSSAVYLAMLLWLRPVSPEQGDILARGRAPLMAWVVDRLARPAARAATECSRR
jgi:O-antigen/teichoic acid export membrane protein